MTTKERRLKHHETAPKGAEGCTRCGGEGIDLGVLHRFDIRVVCSCVEHSTGCLCTKPERVTCGGCDRSWCERCDPAPSALCPWCHGRGHSTAPLDEVKAKHPFDCPKCGSSEQVVFREYVLEQRSVLAIKDTHVEIGGLGTTIYECEKDEHLWCRTCSFEFPIPPDVEIDWI